MKWYSNGIAIHIGMGRPFVKVSQLPADEFQTVIVKVFRGVVPVKVEKI